MKTTAIIVAAGSGSRFKSDTPKQFLELHGKPVIFHTLEKFQAAPSVDSIVLVLAADRVEDLDPAGFSKLKTIGEGGSTRAESVRNGLSAIDKDTEIVVVHDGARPLVSIDEIERTISEAKETGAACLVAPITDTIKFVEDKTIIRTVDRSTLRRALTPQAFRIDILTRAFNQNIPDESVTDEASLVERLDYFYEISAVDGSSHNIKITYPEDLILAEALLKELETRS